MFPHRDPQSLIRIFHIESRKELAAHCKNLTIHADDFANLIWASRLGTIPYRHERYTSDYIPEHLVPSYEEEQALRRAAPKPLDRSAAKFASKIRQTFSDRRLLAGHLFISQDKRFWQFFYFDQRDAAPRGNHWVGGPHIHLVNDLWPNLSADALIESLSVRNPKFGRSLHIRFDRGWKRTVSTDGRGLSEEGA